MKHRMKKCRHCKKRFMPKKNHGHDQEYCDDPECQRESNRASSQKYRDKTEKNLFISGKGTRMVRQTITRIAHKHFDTEEDHASGHTMRRSCATELVKHGGGKHLYEVKEFMGHESVDTLRRYVRLTAVELKRMHKKCHPRERDEE